MLGFFISIYIFISMFWLQHMSLIYPIIIGLKNQTDMMC